MNKLYAKGSLILLCVGGFLTTGCSRDSVAGVEDQLVGRWEWVETTLPSDSLKLTPAVVGHTSAVDFDRRGRARFYQDNSMTGAAQFSLRRRSRRKQLIVYHGYRAHQYYTIVGNRLYLRDTDSEGRGHMFARKRPTPSVAGYPAISYPTQ
ncbi:hypothetical protein MUN82_01540 [Hymenobacter aerilatus]|uniref:Uncharacterized protein n=1 Tax=Hymenobacter aerilatus TaxID=2932251 RepID=A0A8T9SYI2_9BACT|nr:hypothetical protein [Hymenobacter aerilatus]UOR05793.1 hypothetical protein MUN82_01540 [Hymenobacter aerilatus]